MERKERNREERVKTATAKSLSSVCSLTRFKGCVHANHSGTVMDQTLATKCSIICFPPISALFLPPTHITATSFSPHTYRNTHPSKLPASIPESSTYFEQEAGQQTEKKKLFNACWKYLICTSNKSKETVHAAAGNLFPKANICFQSQWLKRFQSSK